MHEYISGLQVRSDTLHNKIRLAFYVSDVDWNGNKELKLVSIVNVPMDLLKTFFIIKHKVFKVENPSVPEEITEKKEIKRKINNDGMII